MAARRSQGQARAVQQDDAQQHQRAQREIGRCAEVRGPGSAAEVGDADLDQADADQGDDDAGDQRRDHPAKMAEETTEDDLHEGAEEAHAEDHREDLLGTTAALLHQHPGGQHGAEEGEAGALQADHPGADAERPARLDQGAGAGNHQRHADQVWQVLAEAEQRADHQRRSDDTDEAGQHVL